MRNCRPLVAASLLLAAMALGATGLASPKLVYNATPSLPHGFYRVRNPAQITYGDLVVFPVPEALRELVFGRRWLPPGGVLMKPVAALPGDRVCIENRTFTVNRTNFGAVLETDDEGRPMPQVSFRGTVGEGELFVGVAGEPRSFDSRYFGAVKAAEILGLAEPLWTY